MKNLTYILAVIILIPYLSACDGMDTRSYLGTMAGAEIGGTIGEAIGWLSTSRHDGPGKAMMGSVLGTVAGAAIGYNISKDKSKRTSRSYDDSNNYSYENQSNYQTGGGYDGGNYRNSYTSQGRAASVRSNSTYFDASELRITRLTYEDENGDGRFSRYETINIIYEVQNTGSRPADVELTIDDSQNSNNFAFSPSTLVTIQPGQTIRYKAKAFCKTRPKNRVANIVATAKSNTHGTASQSVKIRVE